MFYYYHGPPSWATFYPFFFAPLVSDIREVRTPAPAHHDLEYRTTQSRVHLVCVHATSH